MTNPTRSPAKAYLYFVLQVIGCAAAMLMLGYLPTLRLAGDAGLSAMLSAVAVTSLASMIGGYPVFVAHLRGQPNPFAGLISMVMRLVVVAILAVVVSLSVALDSSPFLAWLAISYLLLLVVDTRYATVALRSL